MSISLKVLMEQVEHKVPGMIGREIDSMPEIKGIYGYTGNMDAIISLRDCWAARYPEAGVHYLALRCWGLLIWQPTYLSVIAAECHSVVPDIYRLFQPLPKDGFICGYAMPRHNLHSGCHSECVEHAAEKLQIMCNGLRHELAQLVRLSPRAAVCMQADCVLAAISSARISDTQIDNIWAMERATCWLDLLGLDGASRFFSYQHAEFESIAIDRQICCHHFRRRDGDYCSTCPKLNHEERLARLNADSVQAA